MGVYKLLGVLVDEGDCGRLNLTEGVGIILWEVSNKTYGGKFIRLGEKLYGTTWKNVVACCADFLFSCYFVVLEHLHECICICLSL